MSDEQVVRPHVDGQPAAVTFYRDWEAACRASKWNKAVGRIRLEWAGKMLEFEICKPRHGDAWIQFRRSGYRLRAATSKEVDACRRWKPF